MDRGLNGLESNRLGSVLEWLLQGLINGLESVPERWWDGPTGLSPTDRGLNVGGKDQCTEVSMGWSPTDRGPFLSGCGMYQGVEVCS